MNNIEQIKEQVIGMLKDKGIKLILENDINYRIIRTDSINYVVTCNFIMDRLNLEIENNIIIKCEIG